MAHGTGWSGFIEQTDKRSEAKPHQSSRECGIHIRHSAMAAESGTENNCNRDEE